MATPRVRLGYVEHGGMQAYPQPFQLEGVRFSGFLLEADVRALQTLCDRYLNAPAQGAVVYHAPIPRVMLGVADAAKIQVGADIGREFWIPEVDVSFWIPVVAVERLAGIPVATRFAWLMRYVIVDDAWAAASGREIYGFPKEVGRISKETAPDSEGHERLTHLVVQTLAVERYGPEAKAEIRPLLEVRRLGTPPVNALRQAWGSAREGAEDFFRIFARVDGRVTLPGPGLLVELFDLIVHDEYPLVFLKQFRDAADGLHACYQAVVESLVKVTQFRSGGWLEGEYQLRIASYASHPIVQELGLTGPEPAILDALELDFDFTIGAGRVIGG